MKKTTRIVCIAVALLLSFSLFACQTDLTAGIELARYKTTAKAGLDDYAAVKMQENTYTEEGLTAIAGFVETGQTAIDAAKNETSVDIAVDAAKVAIDAVLTKDETAAAELATYKTSNKNSLDNYVASKTEANYSKANWVTLKDFAKAGKTEIDAVENKTAVDAAVDAAKIAMDGVRIKPSNVFPSVLEEFEVDEFTDEFFEENTLFLVPFEWSHVVAEYVEFYTVFVKDGKLNFLIEVTYPPGPESFSGDYLLFAVTVPNAVLNRCEFGELFVFETYADHSAFGFEAFPPAVFIIFEGCEWDEPTPREWLQEVEDNSVEHRVNVDISSFGYGSYEPGELFKPQQGKLAVISSTQSLQEHLR